MGTDMNRALTTRTKGCEVSTDCRVCPERSGSPWANLSAGVIEALNRTKTTRIHSVGSLLFRQGEPCGGLHCLRSGVVALRKTNELGQSVIVRLVHAGGQPGLRTFFADGPFGTSAVAVVESEVCWFPRQAVEEALRRQPILGRSFLKHLARDMRTIEDEKLAACAPVRDRLVRLLLDLADRYGESQGADKLIFDLPLARQEIAAVLGVRPESVARAVRCLESAGLVEFQRRRVKIPSVEALLCERP